MAYYKDLHVEWSQDNDPDLSWLGAFTSKLPSGEVYIDRQDGCMYVPGQDEPVLTDLPRMGRNEHRYVVSCNYHHAEPDEYECFAQDYKRLLAYASGELYSQHCHAVATIVFQSELGERTEREYSMGLGGIESDCDDAMRKEYEQEQLDELRAELEARGIREEGR